jgi:probable HAF family extracellular repeat protein
MHRPLLAALGLITCAASAFAEPAPRYTLQLLADLPGGNVSSQGMAINASGLVAGQAAGTEGYFATTWAAPDRLPVSLGDLPGGLVSSMVYGINNAGTTVGTAYGTGGLRGFRLNPGGAMQELNDLPGGNSASGALSVNGAGVAVGYSYSSLSGNNTVATLWAPGQQGLELGDLAGGSYNSEARAINDAGMVAGMGTPAAGGKRAFLWTAGGGMVELPDLPGGNWSQPNAINEAGWVAGYSLTTPSGSGFYHAALWRDGQVVDLGAGNFHSFANDVNNLGQVVGTDNNRPVLWTSDLQRHDLASLVDNLPPAFFLSNAMGINDAGQITGWATNGAGERVGYVLTPVGAVPEPGSWALMLAGLGVGGSVARRRAQRR